MGWKTNVAAVLTVATLGIAGLSALEPKTPAQIDKDRIQEQLDQASDAHEQENERRCRLPA